MTLHTEPWPTGTPAWVDLMVPDLGAAQEFYGAVLGWSFPGTGEADAPDGFRYLNAERDGRVVAGVGTMTAGQGGPAPAWATYLATGDVHATVAAASAAGAQVLVPPDSVGPAGTFAWLVDPTGAGFCLWQAGDHLGAQLTDEPGAMTWNELLTADPAAAQEFYGAVFDWTYEDVSGPGFTYATFSVDGQLAGGVGDLAVMRGAGDQPRWLVYFKVEDTDEAAARAEDAGGGVVEPPWDSTYGRIAVLAGPAGETFAIMADVPIEMGAAGDLLGNA